MAQLRVFVSHSSQDKPFADALVHALREAGADVWYDEHNLGAGVLRAEIMRELADRPVFIVVLSRAAFASAWVRDECEWAYNVFRRKPERLILPVAAAPYDAGDFDHLLYLESMKRVETSGNQPYPQAEAIERTLRLLALTPRGEAPTPTTPQPTESAADLIARGKALMAQMRFTEAISLYERATHLDPNDALAWYNLGVALPFDARDEESLAALDRALALDPNLAPAWALKGAALGLLRRPKEEELAAYDRALALDPNFAAWAAKGNALVSLGRYEEAVAAFDRALALYPNHAGAWQGKCFALAKLNRAHESLVACDRALALDPNALIAWGIKGAVLRALGREAEAQEAERRYRELKG
jgi:tetratricopeptide (TPR) repeat protein